MLKLRWLHPREPMASWRKKEPRRCECTSKGDLRTWEKVVIFHHTKNDIRKPPLYRLAIEFQPPGLCECKFMLLNYHSVLHCHDSSSRAILKAKFAMLPDQGLQSRRIGGIKYNNPLQKTHKIRVWQLSAFLHFFVVCQQRT